MPGPFLGTELLIGHTADMKEDLPTIFVDRVDERSSSHTRLDTIKETSLWTFARPFSFLDRRFSTKSRNMNRETLSKEKKEISPLHSLGVWPPILVRCGHQRRDQRNHHRVNPPLLSRPPVWASLGSGQTCLLSFTPSLLNRLLQLGDRGEAEIATRTGKGIFLFVPHLRTTSPLSPDLCRLRVPVELEMGHMSRRVGDGARQ